MRQAGEGIAKLLCARLIANKSEKLSSGFFLRNYGLKLGLKRAIALHP
jgi:hypothetical protein